MMDPSTGGKLATETIPQDVNSFHYTFGKVPYEMFLLDNRHLKGQAKKWVREKRPLKSSPINWFFFLLDVQHFSMLSIKNNRIPLILQNRISINKKIDILPIFV